MDWSLGEDSPQVQRVAMKLLARVMCSDMGVVVATKPAPLFAFEGSRSGCELGMIWTSGCVACPAPAPCVFT